MYLLSVSVVMCRLTASRTSLISRHQTSSAWTTKRDAGSSQTIATHFTHFTKTLNKKISTLFFIRPEFLATDPEARVRFPALTDFLEKKKKKNSSGSGGPLSLVSTTEKLLDRKVAALV
jgi:hypothetical protein